MFLGIFLSILFLYFCVSRGSMKVYKFFEMPFPSIVRLFFIPFSLFSFSSVGCKQQHSMYFKPHKRQKRPKKKQQNFSTPNQIQKAEKKLNNYKRNKQTNIKKRKIEINKKKILFGRAFGVYEYVLCNSSSHI